MVCDEQLVQRFLAGNENVFREIVDRYKGYVFSIILNFVRQHDEAENIAQEVFIQVYCSLPRYHSQNFKGWIGRIATNKAIDWQRARARREREELVIDIEGFLAEQNRLQKTPEEMLLQKEQNRRIREVCLHMPELYSGVIMKYYFEGKTYQQIAAEDGITVKTVESRLYRARNILKEKWREEE